MVSDALGFQKITIKKRVWCIEMVTRRLMTNSTSLRNQKTREKTLTAIFLAKLFLQTHSFYYSLQLEVDMDLFAQNILSL